MKAPTRSELSDLTHGVARRVGCFLEREGLLERDAGDSYLSGDAVEGRALGQLLGHSVTYRIAVGRHAGRKVFALQTLPDCNEPCVDDVGMVAGFSLHAGVAARAHERKKLERLCRYIARPAVSEKRLSLLRNGHVRYELKTPYRDGTTHVIFELMELMAHIPVRHPWGDLRSSKSAILPICHCAAGCPGAQPPGQPHSVPRSLRPRQRAPCTGDAGQAWQG